MARKTSTRKSTTESKTKLTKEDIQTIFDQTGLNEKGTNKELKRTVLKSMRKLTYDRKYKSCWDGKPQRDIWSQALSKVQCFLKYGDKF